MVQKVTAGLILIVSFAFGPSANANTISVLWTGSKDSSCQGLIDHFLTELRSIASDDVIELSALPNKEKEQNESALIISCQKDGVLVAKPEAQAEVRLRYQRKAQGFDANDWVVFQKRFLKPSELPSLPQLAPSYADPGEPFHRVLPGSEAEIKSGSFYSRWWFWPAIATIGTGAFVSFYYLKTHAKNTIDIEIK